MPLLIPTAPLPPTTTEPRTVAFYGDQKIGKSETIAKLGQLPGSLLHVDTHNGTAFINTRRVTVESLADWLELGRQLPAAWKAAPFRWLAIDVLDDVENWAEEQATADYRRFPIGRGFGGQSVLELDKGLGYNFLRNAMLELVKPVWGNNWWTTIFVVHSRAKWLGENPTATSDQANSDQLDLTGKVRKLVCNKVDAVGHFTKTNGQLQLSFVTQEKIICGLRARYLHNKVVKFSDPALPEEWKAVWPETWDQPARVEASAGNGPVAAATTSATTSATKPAAPVAATKPAVAAVPMAVGKPVTSTAPTQPTTKPATPASPAPPQPPISAK